MTRSRPTYRQAAAGPCNARPQPRTAASARPPCRGARRPGPGRGEVLGQVELDRVAVRVLAAAHIHSTRVTGVHALLNAAAIGGSGHNITATERTTPLRFATCEATIVRVRRQAQSRRPVWRPGRHRRSVSTHERRRTHHRAGCFACCGSPPVHSHSSATTCCCFLRPVGASRAASRRFTGEAMVTPRGRGRAAGRRPSSSAGRSGRSRKRRRRVRALRHGGWCLRHRLCGRWRMPCRSR